jgi:LEA14-like dessication related protein
MNSLKKPILCFSLLFLIAGCQAVKQVAKNIKKPTLSVSGVHVSDFSFTDMTLLFDVKVDNPDPVALHMLSYDYNFKINDNSFVKGDHNKRLDIAAAGASTFQIPVTINFKDLYKLYQSLRVKDTTGYKLLANLHFNIPVLGNTKIPLKTSGAFPLLKLPKIHIANIKVGSINLSKANVVMNLVVDNPNGFALLLNNINYHLDVNGRRWVDVNKSKHLSIDKNKSREISLPLSLNISQIGASVIQLLQHSGHLNYHLNGKLDFGLDQALFKNKSTIFHFNTTGKAPLAHQ